MISNNRTQGPNPEIILNFVLTLILIFNFNLILSSNAKHSQKDNPDPDLNSPNPEIIFNFILILVLILRLI